MNIFLLGLFPKAVEYKSFNRVSNPYECDIGGMYFTYDILDKYNVYFSTTHNRHLVLLILWHIM